MATAETVDLGDVHPPKHESINTFNELLDDIQKEVLHQRHEANKHEPEYFKAVADLSDRELTSFSADDLKEVRVATSAYGLHLFGKVEFAEKKGSYFMFRAFIGGEGPKLHSLRMDETEKPDGDKVYNAIFSKDDKLEWFDT